MARLNAMPSIKPIEISKWLGLNESTVSTELKKGEWESGYNFRVDENYHIEKRPAGVDFISDLPNAVMQGIWIGKVGVGINEKNVMLFITTNDVYEYDMDVSTTTTVLADLITEGTVTLLGNMGSESFYTDFSIFKVLDTVYIMRGNKNYTYDGSTFQELDPYVPTIALDAPPSGGGTLFEETNMLGRYVKQRFIADGTSTAYYLAFDIDTGYSPTVTINGSTTTAYTVDGSNDKIDFTSAPANQAEVIVEGALTGFSLGNMSGLSNAIKYGVNSEITVFLYGEESREYRYSKPNDPTYFAANSVIDFGYGVTGMQAQYQSLLVFSEDNTGIIKPSSNPAYEDNKGLHPYRFGFEMLNNTIGNEAPGKVPLIGATPVTFHDNTFRRWVSNYGVSGEIEPKDESARVAVTLKETDFSTIHAIDYEKENELMVALPNNALAESEIVVWNYGNDTFYKYYGRDVYMRYPVADNGVLYYDNYGSIKKFDPNSYDNVDAVIYGGFTDCGTQQYRKTMTDQWLTLKPYGHTSCELGFATDRENSEDITFKSKEYASFNFDDIDFDNFTFNTNSNPQTFRYRIKVTNFYNVQWIIRNFEDQPCSPIKLTFMPEILEY